MNLQSEVRRIERLIVKQTGGSFKQRKYTFSDGSTIELYPHEVKNMFVSALQGEPTKEALFFYEKYKQGIYDDIGLVHFLSVYLMDQDEIWNEE